MNSRKFTCRILDKTTVIPLESAPPGAPHCSVPLELVTPMDKICVSVHGVDGAVVLCPHCAWYSDLGRESYGESTAAVGEHINHRCISSLVDFYG